MNKIINLITLIIWLVVIGINISNIITNTYIDPLTYMLAAFGWVAYCILALIRGDD